MYFPGPSMHCSLGATSPTPEHTMTTQNTKFEQLLDLVEGRLTQDQAQQLTDEIAADAELRTLHQWVSNFHSMADRTTLVPAPASTRAKLLELLPRPRRIGDAVDQAMDFVGRLIRDVTAGPSFAGARGAALDSTRQLLFDGGDDTDVAVALNFSNDVLHISGQLLTDDTTGDVQVASDASTANRSIDEFGEFSTTIQIPTSLQLQISTTQGRIHIDLTPYLEPAGPSTGGAT
jgi:hypothetical protein